MDSLEKIRRYYTIKQVAEKLNKSRQQVLTIIDKKGIVVLKHTPWKIAAMDLDKL